MKTALYDRHMALGAKMVSFAGWEMPVQYQGVIAEHQAVRQGVGIFDVSHMGRVCVTGPEAEPFLDYLSTNKIAGKGAGTATYTVWGNAQGGSVDDVIVYKQDATHFFIIVNAGNRQKDLDHLRHYATGYDIDVRDCYSEEGILAIQGPRAMEVGGRLLPDVQKVRPMHFVEVPPLILSGTGYTGAGGFEIYAPTEHIVALWDLFIKEGVVPIGLGARDTLRLEMGYALYGHELSDGIAPNESVSAWTVKWDKGDFLGKEAMQHLEASGKKRGEYGIELLDRGIPREGYEVYKEGRRIGQVTSGTHSPTLNRGIALVLVDEPLKVGDRLEVQIRNQKVPATVQKLGGHHEIY